MQIDTWYDLAVRELSELTDPARALVSEAEKAAMAEKDAATPKSDEPAEPPGQAA